MEHQDIPSSELDSGGSDGVSFEARHRALVADNMRALAPIMDDLRGAGVMIEQFQHLYTSGWDGQRYVDKATFAKAVPILLKWIRLVSNRDIKCALCEALSNSWVRPPQFELLVKEYCEYAGDSYVQWFIAQDVCRVAKPRHYQTIRELVTSPRHGSSRGMLVRVLPKLRNADAVDLAISALREPELAGFAIEALGRLKDSRACPHIRPFLRDERAFVRRAAKKSLRRLGEEVELPPKAVHMVGRKARMPPGLGEWSTSMDLEDVSGLLCRAGAEIQAGLGAAEGAEVEGVAEQLETDENRVFRFPIIIGGAESDAWVLIRKEDETTVDLYVFGSEECLAAFRRAVH